MNGWKVIRAKDRRSAITTIACAILFNYILTYLVGVTIKPKVTGTKLLFFKNKKDAERFRDINDTDYNQLIIVPCVANGVSKIKVVSNLWDIDHFWKLKRAKRGVGAFSWNAPSGTYGADSIKCLE